MEKESGEGKKMKEGRMEGGDDIMKTKEGRW